jgi:hypothetical protein
LSNLLFVRAKVERNLRRETRHSSDGRVCCPRCSCWRAQLSRRRSKRDIKDVTSTLPLSTESGQSIAVPLPMGINYQFQIQSDMIV